jgi:hypothetical protein
MPGFGPRAGAEADTTPQVVDRDAAASLYHQAFADGKQAGRQEADWDIAAGLLGQNQELRAHMAADQELAAYGPGGREHFGDPRPGDFTGRGSQGEVEPEQEAEAG